MPNPSLFNQILVGDCRELSRHIEDESIDLVFTDPPYLREHLPLYDWLGQEAERVLKPGGFLLTYVGSLWKYENMLALGKSLTYFYDYVATHSGPGTILWARKTVSRHKSILAFVKGKGKPRCNTLSLWTGTGSDKRYHVWGQEEGTARYYVDCFSSPGDVIWEPFCGGGTVPYVCMQLRRHYIAFEIDAGVASIASERLSHIQPFLPIIGASQLSFEEEQACSS